MTEEIEVSTPKFLPTASATFNSYIALPLSRLGRTDYALL